MSQFKTLQCSPIHHLQKNIHTSTWIDFYNKAPTHLPATFMIWLPWTISDSQNTIYFHASLTNVAFTCLWWSSSSSSFGKTLCILSWPVKCPRFGTFPKCPLAPSKMNCFLSILWQRLRTQLAWVKSEFCLFLSVSSGGKHLSFLLYKMRTIMFIVTASNNCVLVAWNAQHILVILKCELLEYRNHIIYSFLSFIT